MTASDVLTLRPSVAADFDYCYQILLDGMADYVTESFGGWNDDEERAIFAGKFARDIYAIIEMNGLPIGCLALETLRDEFILEPIAIAPEFQGRGLGTRLLCDNLVRADRDHLPVRLRCLKSNPSKRLYDRLGFQVIEDQGVRWIMRYEPRAKSAGRSQTVPRH